MHRVPLKPGERGLVLLWLLAIAAYATLIRCLHLLDTDHYYIVSPDSYFFHWQAERALSGQDLAYSWHAGLTYPLAYTARVISLVAGMAPPEALTLAGKILPPTLGVVSVVLMYLAASRMYNWRVGLGAAFAWSVYADAWFGQVAGYLDRDGLTVLLLMAGVFLFHFSRRWHLRVMGKDIGWVAGALVVMGIEGLLTLEWVWVGAVLLLTVLLSYVILEALFNFLPYLLSVWNGRDGGSQATRRLLRGAVASFSRSNWRPLGLVLGVNVAIGLYYPGLSGILDTTAYYMGGTVAVAELVPMTTNDLLRPGLLIVPLLVGLYIGVTRHRKADLLCLGWFLSLVGLALFSSRILLLAAPATCLIAGVGLAWFLDLKSASKSPTVLGRGTQVMALPSGYVMKVCGTVLLLAMLLLISPRVARNFLSDRGAADQDWQAALSYMKHETPEDSVVMSWWDYGYWILDLGDRRSVVDNGLAGWDEERLDDIGLAYCTADPAVAAEVMRRYGAGYLVFSRVEGTLLEIPQRGLDDGRGDDKVTLDDLKESLYYQSLNGGFQSGGGLKRVYPAPGEESPGVVILALD